MATKSDAVKLAIEMFAAVSQAIQAAGEIPAGHLYAALMTYGCTLENFNSIIRILSQSTPPLVIRRGDLLVWNGPAVLEAAQ